MKQFLFKHWDLVISVAIVVELFQHLPARLSTAFLKDAYSGGIAVLAVVFSVVFAALSLLASIGDDEFLTFLEDEDNALSTLLKSFKTTLNLLFGGLIVSIVLFGIASYLASVGHKDQESWSFALFCFTVIYALISSRLIANDVIHFAMLRAKFLAAVRRHRRTRED